MKIFWIILYVSKDRSRIKNIKIDARDYTSQEMKKLIYQEFDLDYDTNLRLRNNQNCLIPINMHIEANTKKNPYILEVYKLQRNSQKNTGMVKSRPVTHRPEKREATAFAVRIVISQYLNRLNKIEDLIDLKHKLLKESFHKGKIGIYEVKKKNGTKNDYAELKNQIIPGVNNETSFLKILEFEDQINYIERSIRHYEDSDWKGCLMKPVLW